MFTTPSEPPRPLLEPPFATGVYAELKLTGIANNNTAEHLKQRFRETGATVLYGGYLEHRELYRNFNHFEKAADPVRDVHLGIDFWAPEGTPVYCPFAGKLHSFANRSLPGDYGPVLLLEHFFNGAPLYTLYGHLSIESLSNLKPEQSFNTGDVLGYLGLSKENGGYEPHLHFQLIRDLGNWKGDYPGVAAASDLQFYRENCPNPLEFLGY
ncbi:MAG: hypothetical protein RLZZ241_825 [Bacteroidota bacterium]|jgi:murein DD-endopeptidase MepM/ murein hydrolase activator NlpD